MPRGKKKRGAWDCTIWFADGSRFRLTSLKDRTFTDAQILEDIEKNLLPILRASAGAAPEQT